MTQRTRRGLAGSVLVVVALVVGAVIVTALRAEGREHTEARTNDGGAWLLKRDLGYVGHANRAVNEIDSKVAVAASGADFDTDQAKDIVLVHDRSIGAAVVVDDANARRGTTVAGLANTTVVDAVDDGVYVYDTAALAVWHFSAETFRSLETLEGQEPILRGEGPGLMATFDDGHAVIADQAAGQIVFLRPDGSTERSEELPLNDEITGITALGPDTAVIAEGDGDLMVATPDEVRPLASVTGPDGAATAVVLQQPGAASDRVVAATPGGSIVTIPLDGSEPTTMADFGANNDPVAPLVVRNCVFAVVQNMPTYQQLCNGEPVEPPHTLGTKPARLRLRLVNGWVWINDVDNGDAWTAVPEQPIQQVEKWDSILATGDEPDDSTGNQGTIEVERVDPNNPDPEIVESDPIEEGPNEPPVAVDDATATRIERPVIVDVLTNDTDPNGDVLIVTGVQLTAGDAVVTVTPGGGGVQVSPNVGFQGAVSFEYSISDGRGGTASAVGTVTVSDSAANQPPEPVNDVASTRRGRPVSFDVLTNDNDPDGDALVLQSIELADPETTAGLLHMTPSGPVTFTPDPNSTREHIELTYVVSDDAGATAEGTVGIDVRLADSNNEPDARNDFTTTVVDRPARLKLLRNDTDPDNDPLYLAGQPTVVQPEGATVGQLDLSVTPDGELFFNPTAAGTYVFTYAVTDGFESDVAQIRVDVSEAAENRPPIAVRDDVVIPAGATRLVEVLDNDGDPDNDVVAIVDLRGSEHLDIEEVDGSGFMVGVAANAPDRVTFGYAVSDGRSEPVWTTVVVSVIDAVELDAAPVARDDTTEARPGGRITVPVLDNDSDPELGVLEVSAVGEVDGVTAEIGLNGQTVDVTLAETVTSTVRLGYTVRDEAGNQSSAVISVAIVPPDQPNRPPIARTDIARTRAGVPVLIDVVGNDSDLDGDLIATEAVTGQPTNGTAEIVDGQLVYTPTETFSGTDRVSYALVDAQGGRSIGEVLIGVLPLAGENRAPFAADDFVDVIAGSATVELEVLANDSDPDRDPLFVTRVGTPTSGEATVPDGGSVVRYTPPASGNADGTPSEVSLPYAIADGRGGVAEGTIHVTVRSATEPIAPIATDDLIGPVAVGQVVEIDLRANDIDPDGGPRELVVTSDDPALAELSGDGTIQYTVGETSARHEYTITDEAGLSDTGTLSVLTVANRAPEVTTATATVAAGGSIELNIPELAAVTDPDGDPLTYACCDGRVGGSTSLVTSGAEGLVVTFTPDAGFVGEASFSYEVDDGAAGHVVSGAVVIEVTAPENTAPVATDGAFTVVAGTTTPVDLASLVTDADPNETLTFTVSGSQGPIEIAQDGSVAAIDTAIDQTGQAASFDYTVTDAAGATASATVTLTIEPSDQPAPEALADQGRTLQGEAVTIPVLANDVDHVGQGLTIASAGVSPAGTTAIAGDGITFTPRDDFFGTATFSYTVQDARRITEREAAGQVTVVVVGRPSPPGTPSATADNGTAVVTWSPSEGNGAGITDYVVTGGGQSISTGGGTTATFSNLTNGEPVTFTVVAVNEAGQSDPSAPSAPVTPDVVPGRPAAPTATFADSALIVRWSPPANDGSAISGYNLMIGGSASGVVELGTATEYRWEGLQNGQQYTFQVQAVNAKGPGEWSAASAPEHPLRAPSPPTSVTGVSGDRYIDVSFTPGDNGGEAPSRYDVMIVSTGAIRPTTGTTLRWSDLPNGEPQQFQVRAVNRAGPSEWSAASTPVTPCGAPGAPSGVTATRGDTQATVTWGAAAANGCAITQYQVVSSGGQSQTVDGGTLTATVGGLANGTSYTFTVTAVNEKGSTASAASNAVTPAGLPCAPGNLRARPAVKAVDLQWDAACPNGSPIVGYEISINGGGWTGVGDVTSHRVTGLQDSTDYSFRVRAVNDVGAGAPSNTASARTPGAPDAPGCFSTSAGNGRIEASWCAPNANGEPITGYRAEIDPGGVRDVGGTSTSWDGLNNGQTYRVRVRACNNVGCGEWTAWRSETPRSPRSIQISKGSSAVGQPGCTDSSCRFIQIDASGLQPNTGYQVDCFSSSGGQFDTGNQVVTTGPNGGLSAQTTCYYGYPGNRVWITLNGIRSDNTITW